MSLSSANADTDGYRTFALDAAAEYPPFELRVEEDGVHRVTYEQLRDAGLDLAGVPATDIALTSRGEPVAITVGGGSSFGPGSFVEFIGEALDTLYTQTNVYRLVVDASLAARVGTDTKSPTGNASPPTYYLETVSVENERQYSFAAPNGDPWYDARMLAYQSPKSWAFAPCAWRPNTTTMRWTATRRSPSRRPRPNSACP